MAITVRIDEKLGNRPQKNLNFLILEMTILKQESWWSHTVKHALLRLVLQIYEEAYACTLKQGQHSNQPSMVRYTTKAVQSCVNNLPLDRPGCANGGMQLKPNTSEHSISTLTIHSVYSPDSPTALCLTRTVDILIMGLCVGLLSLPPPAVLVL